MKQFLLSMVLSSGFAASLAVPAFAQDNPNTTQTDQSEEDWRKSKKKTTTDDPWDGFKNTNGWGQGTQRSLSPVDLLPEDSRRFLMKERAQRLAEAGIGEPVDTSFEPSDEAKSDPSLESDEKAAWAELMKDLGGSGTPPAGNPNGDPNADPSGQSGSAPQIPTQVGEFGGSAGSAGAATPSVMRGGSSASVSDILAQIKGGGAAPSGQAQDQGQQNQAQQSQAQGQAPTAADIQAQNQGQSQGQDQAQAQNQTQADAQAQQSGAAQSNADAQAQASADAQAQAQAAADSAATRTPESISPLDRLKQVREARDSNGARSSASDYLNRGN